MVESLLKIINKFIVFDNDKCIKLYLEATYICHIKENAGFYLNYMNNKHY